MIIGRFTPTLVLPPKGGGNKSIVNPSRKGKEMRRGNPSLRGRK